MACCTWILTWPLPLELFPTAIYIALMLHLYCTYIALILHLYCTYIALIMHSLTAIFVGCAVSHSQLNVFHTPLSNWLTDKPNNWLTNSILSSLIFVRHSTNPQSYELRISLPCAPKPLTCLYLEPDETTQSQTTRLKLGWSAYRCTTIGGCHTKWRCRLPLHNVWWLWHWVVLQLTAAQRLVVVTLSGIAAYRSQRLVAVTLSDIADYRCTMFGGCDTEWHCSLPLHNVLCDCDTKGKFLICD